MQGSSRGHTYRVWVSSAYGLPRYISLHVVSPAPTVTKLRLLYFTLTLLYVYVFDQIKSNLCVCAFLHTRCLDAMLQASRLFVTSTMSWCKDCVLPKGSADLSVCSPKGAQIWVPSGAGERLAERAAKAWAESHWGVPRWMNWGWARMVMF